MLGLGLAPRLALLGLGLGAESSLLGFRIGVIGEEEEGDLEKKEVIWRCWLTSGDRPLLRRRDAIDEGFAISESIREKREREVIVRRERRAGKREN